MRCAFCFELSALSQRDGRKSVQRYVLGGSVSLCLTRYAVYLAAFHISSEGLSELANFSGTCEQPPPRRQTRVEIIMTLQVWRVDRRLTGHLQPRETCTSSLGREPRVAWFQEKSEPRVAWFRERSSWANVLFLWEFFSANPSDLRTRPTPQVLRLPQLSTRLGESA